MIMSHTPVHHNPSTSRFEVNMGGATALLEYVRAGGRVTFVHTFVPPEHRGQGIAEQIVRAALEWARGEQLKVVPQCSYTARFIERHPEFASLLAPA
ncbi:MAG: GNAT family N-acetyltransferase [Nibricoccus sp.]